MDSICYSLSNPPVRRSFDPTLACRPRRQIDLCDLEVTTHDNVRNTTILMTRKKKYTIEQCELLCIALRRYPGFHIGKKDYSTSSVTPPGLWSNGLIRDQCIWEIQYTVPNDKLQIGTLRFESKRLQMTWRMCIIPPMIWGCYQRWWNWAKTHSPCTV